MKTNVIKLVFYETKLSFFLPPEHEPYSPPFVCTEIICAVHQSCAFSDSWYTWDTGKSMTSRPSANILCDYHTQHCLSPDTLPSSYRSLVSSLIVYYHSSQDKVNLVSELGPQILLHLFCLLSGREYEGFTNSFISRLKYQAVTCTC